VKEISGLQLFLRYAWPCAEDKLRAGTIGQEDFKRLKKWLDNKTGRLDIAVLRRCFPAAITAYEEFCEKKKHRVDYSFGSVAEFWRYHHGHSGNCAVKRGKVIELYENRVKVEVDSVFNWFCLNPYRLKLQLGDWVFFHRHVIVEK
jgi:hypothetical protein